MDPELVCPALGHNEILGLMVVVLLSNFQLLCFKPACQNFYSGFHWIGPHLPGDWRVQRDRVQRHLCAYFYLRVQVYIMYTCTLLYSTRLCAPPLLHTYTWGGGEERLEIWGPEYLCAWLYQCPCTCIFLDGARFCTSPLFCTNSWIHYWYKYICKTQYLVCASSLINNTVD